VSVVVPTYNRQAILSRTLDSLLRQKTESVEYEVIVVDNNSSDGTRALVETYVRQSPQVKYLLETRRGVSHARNTGIAAARAPIIAFIDDDVEAGPTWIATLKQVLDAHPEIDCIGGLITPRWSAPPPSWLTPLFWGPVALQAHRGPPPYFDADHATRCLMTANFSCRRDALEKVGGFSPDYFRDEDRELQLRLWAAGKRGLYVDDVAVTTEVPRERLTKRYHRQFWVRVGASHARMRYLERVDARGRLLREIPSHATLLGAPAFVYRNVFRHATGLIRSTATLQWDQAFFHETRLLYFTLYVWTRYREENPSLRAIVRETHHLMSALLNRRRPPASSKTGSRAKAQ
jgi:glycosyltransferase involved in cell wall biosynthesis